MPASVSRALLAVCVSYHTDSQEEAIHNQRCQQAAWATTSAVRSRAQYGEQNDYNG